MLVNKGAAVVVLAIAVVASSSIAWASNDANGPANTKDQAQAGEAVGTEAAPTYQPASSESQYVALTTPCLAVSTGKIGTTIPPGGTRHFVMTGSTGFAEQGGQASGCGVPTGATAVTGVLIARSQTTQGSLNLAPDNGQTPTLLTLAYQSAGETSSTGFSSGLSDSGLVQVLNKNGTPAVSISITGYFVKPLAGFISPSGTPYSGSSRIVNATRVGVGTYEVQFDRNIRYCSATATVYVSNYYASASTWYDSTRPDTVRVYVWALAGNTADQYFYIQVDC